MKKTHRYLFAVLITSLMCFCSSCLEKESSHSSLFEPSSFSNPSSSKVELEQSSLSEPFSSTPSSSKVELDQSSLSESLSSANSSFYKQELDQATISELTAFFNSNLYDVSIYTNTNGELSQPITIYSDQNVFISNSVEYSDYEEIITLDYHYLEGDGFKVYTPEDNSDLFTNEDVNILKYMTFVCENIDLARLEFNLSVSEIPNQTSHAFLDQAKEELLSIKSSLETVQFYINLNDYRKVSSLEFVLDRNIYDTSRLFYTINAYNEALERRTVSLDGYYLVNKLEFNHINYDIQCYLDHGEGSIYIEYNYVGNLFFNIIPEDLVIGELSSNFYNNGDRLNIEILLKDIAFDRKTKKGTYYFCGKPFSVHFDYYFESIDIDLLETRPFVINYTPGVNRDHYGSIRYDTPLNRVILKTGETLSIIDTSSLQVIKEYIVEGEIVNIIIHDDVYHIMTVTQGLGSHSGYEDNICKGNIYAIDKNSLELTKLVSLDTYPYYTAIDNRGDIIVVPGYGQWVPIYLFHPLNNSIEIIAEKSAFEGSYIEYNKQEDMFLINDMRGNGAIRPEFYYYKNGKYVRDDGEFLSDEYTHYGQFPFTFKNYVVTKASLADVSDWHNPKSTRILEIVLTTKCDSTMRIVFCDENAVYYVLKYKEKTLFYKVEIVAGEIQKTLYTTTAQVNECSFGFARDGIVYLYDVEQQALLSFDLS